MNFLDAIAISLLILILLVIVNNIFLYGRDLAKYPRRTERDIERDINDYYPGSPQDDYETDYESDQDDNNEDDDDEQNDENDHQHHMAITDIRNTINLNRNVLPNMCLLIYLVIKN